MKRLRRYPAAVGPVLAVVAMLVLGQGAFSEGKTWKVAIVADTTQDFSAKIHDGFVAALDGLLAKRGDKAAYAEYNTELSPEKAARIVEALKASQPDLVFDINNPAAFADLNVAAKLKDPKFCFVSENCIPVQSGIAKSWDRPGGNVTGVSIFVKFNAQIRLMRRLRPEISKLVMFSWSAVQPLNDWYMQEVRRACDEEGVELVEFGLVPNFEAELDFLKKYADKGKDYFISGVVSAWAHADGRPADADIMKVESGYFQDRMRIPLVCYDEVAVSIAGLAGACVIWSDLGAQAAEKGLRIIGGAKPGDLPWEYPRGYNIVLNLAMAKRLGITLPQDLINAAYRVYTDLEGNYAGGGR
jgi:putative tryptophan/tyrosine transport system substrate-binding protein